MKNVTIATKFARYGPQIKIIELYFYHYNVDVPMVMETKFTQHINDRRTDGPLIFIKSMIRYNQQPTTLCEKNCRYLNINQCRTHEILTCIILFCTRKYTAVSTFLEYSPWNGMSLSSWRWFQFKILNGVLI